MHEAKKIVNAGKVKIDNIIRYNVNFAVGLMDTIEFNSFTTILSIHLRIHFIISNRNT
jgi:ribosomal protein S4E